MLGDPGARRLFDDRVYKRGALTLHALRRVVGDLAFFAMLREWTSANRHGNVTTDMFLDLALQYATRSYDGFFASWLYGTRLPPLPDRGEPRTCSRRQTSDTPSPTCQARTNEFNETG